MATTDAFQTLYLADGFTISHDNGAGEEWRTETICGEVFNVEPVGCYESGSVRSYNEHETLSLAQMESLCAYYGTTPTDDASTDAAALIEVLEVAMSDRDLLGWEWTLLGSLHATVKADRFSDAHDGADRWNIGHRDGLDAEVISGAQWDNLRHTAEGADDTTEYDGAAMERLYSNAERSARRESQATRTERHAKLAAYVDRCAAEFMGAWERGDKVGAQPWAQRLKAAGAGIRARYVSSVRECAKHGQWSVVYLTKAQKTDLSNRISAAFSEAKRLAARRRAERPDF